MLDYNVQVITNPNKDCMATLIPYWNIHDVVIAT